MSFEEWLSTTHYPDWRKDQLRQVQHGLKGGNPTRKQCQRVDTFGKVESYPQFKHMRMINSRCDAFKVFSGPLFKAVESVIYQNECFVKHNSLSQKMMKVNELNQAGLYFYATDFTAFESHFTPEFMEACELKVYRKCLKWCNNIDLLCNTIKGTNKMRTRHGVKAQV